MSTAVWLKLTTLENIKLKGKGQGKKRTYLTAEKVYPLRLKQKMSANKGASTVAPKLLMGSILA